MPDELELVDWITRRASRGGQRSRVRLGPGDDAAVVSMGPGEEIVFTIDEIVEGMHFRLKGRGAGPRARPLDIGYKALASAASDLAAMGAEPVSAVVAVALRAGQAGGFAKALYKGMERAAEALGCPLVGGNVAETSGPVSVTTAVLGKVPEGRAVLRSGARPGDVIYVTGELGGSSLGRHLKPEPRLAEGVLLREKSLASAMIDVSDGLALDLTRLADSSGVGVVLEAGAVPVSAAARRLARADGRTPLEHALSDGEDYELLFAVRKGSAGELERRWRGNFAVGLSRIGEVRPRRAGLRIRDERGRVRALRSSGFRHL